MKGVCFTLGLESLRLVSLSLKGPTQTDSCPAAVLQLPHTRPVYSVTFALAVLDLILESRSNTQ